MNEESQLTVEESNTPQNQESTVETTTAPETEAATTLQAGDANGDGGSGEEVARTTEAGSASENASEKKSTAVEASDENADQPKDLPWYVVHAYSGFEGRVKLSLEERVRNAKLQDKFGRIIVPQETVVELVRGEKKTSTRKFFPGYMLMQIELNDETWHLVKDTPKVTGFVGNAHSPLPLTPQEVQNLFEQMEGGAKRPRPKVQFEDGDSVKVVDGPFADFNGVVDEVKPDKGKLRVLISIFGRNTPVELDFVQVEKV